MTTPTHAQHLRELADVRKRSAAAMGAEGCVLLAQMDAAESAALTAGADALERIARIDASPDAHAKYLRDEADRSRRHAQHRRETAARYRSGELAAQVGGSREAAEIRAADYERLAVGCDAHAAAMGAGADALETLAEMTVEHPFACEHGTVPWTKCPECAPHGLLRAALYRIAKDEEREAALQAQVEQSTHLATDGWDAYSSAMNRLTAAEAEAARLRALLGMAEGAEPLAFEVYCAEAPATPDGRFSGQVYLDNDGEPSPCVGEAYGADRERAMALARENAAGRLTATARALRTT